MALAKAEKTICFVATFIQVIKIIVPSSFSGLGCLLNY